MANSPTGGVRPMEIRSRMYRERERCIGMTEDERSWRARFLKEQILTEREPVHVKELQFRNPIRTFYATPLDKLVLHPLTPKLVKQLPKFIGKFWPKPWHFLLCNCWLIGVNGT